MNAAEFETLMASLPSPKEVAHARLDALMESDPHVAEQVCIVILGAYHKQAKFVIEGAGQIAGMLR